MASKPIAGGGDLIETETEYGTAYYPVSNPLKGLEALDPDAVMIHVISPSVLEHLPEISTRWPTAMRLGWNLSEFAVKSNWRNRLGSFLYSLEGVDCIICPSKHVEENLNRMKIHNTVTIPTSVDTGEYELSKAENDAIVSLTRLSPIKNLETSVLAMQSVISEVPSAQYLIFGLGEMSNMIKNMISAMQTEDIRSMGWADSRDVLPKAKVFLQLSHSENFSMSVLEAMASGVPVVCSDIPGHPEKGVVRVPPWSVDKATEEVKRLLTDEEYWSEWRKKGLEEVKYYDTKKEVLPMYESLFESLVQLGRFKKKELDESTDRFGRSIVEGENE